MQLFTSKTSAWKFTCSFHFRDKRTISLILYRKLFQRFVLYDTACWVRVTIRPMALPVLLSIFQHQRTVHVVLHIPRHMYILRTHTHTRTQRHILWTRAQLPPPFVVFYTHPRTRGPMFTDAHVFNAAYVKREVPSSNKSACLLAIITIKAWGNVKGDVSPIQHSWSIEHCQLRPLNNKFWMLMHIWPVFSIVFQPSEIVVSWEFLQTWTSSWLMTMWHGRCRTINNKIMGLFNFFSFHGNQTFGLF